VAKREWRRTKAAGRFLWGSGRLLSKGTVVLLAMAGSGLGVIGWVFAPSTTRSIVRHGRTTLITVTNTPHWPFALVGIVVAFMLVFLIHGVQLERGLENQSKEHRSAMQGQQGLLEKERQEHRSELQHQQDLLEREGRAAQYFIGGVHFHEPIGATGASVSAQPLSTGSAGLSGAGTTGSIGSGILSVVPDRTVLSPNNEDGDNEDP
jgi:hypothetical protein